MFYVSTALPISKHLPALGLPGLDLEFEICHPPEFEICSVYPGNGPKQTGWASAKRKIFPFVLGGGEDSPMEWWLREVTDTPFPSGNGAEGSQSWQWGGSGTQDPKPPSTTMTIIP